MIPKTKPCDSPIKRGIIEKVGENPYLVYWVLVTFGILAIVILVTLFAFINREVSTDVKWPEAWSAFAAVWSTIATTLGGLFLFFVFIKYQRVKHLLDKRSTELQNEAIEIQRDVAKIKMGLALNVIVSTRVIKHLDQRVLEVKVDVENISNKDYYVPAVYVSGRQIIEDATSDQSNYFKLQKSKELQTRNAARFPTICSLSSMEKEVFTTWFILGKISVEKYPTVVIRVSVVGAAGYNAFSDEFTYRKFLKFMNEGGGHTFNMFQAWPSDQKHEQIRSQPDMPKKRCLYLPPSMPEDDPKEVDLVHSKDFKNVLESTVMWDRYKVISLGEKNHCE
jgi:hypothetical protein